LNRLLLLRVFFFLGSPFFFVSFFHTPPPTSPPSSPVTDHFIAPSLPSRKVRSSILFSPSGLCPLSRCILYCQLFPPDALFDAKAEIRSRRHFLLARLLFVTLLVDTVRQGPSLPFALFSPSSFGNGLSCLGPAGLTIDTTLVFPFRLEFPGRNWSFVRLFFLCFPMLAMPFF